VLATQYGPALATAGAMLAIFALAPSRPAWSRAAVSALVMLLLARYLCWRVSFLPRLADLGDAWKLFCFGIEALFAFDTFVLFLLLSRRVDRSPEADRHEARLRQFPPRRLPAVDVFIPTYNEGIDVLERSIVGALGIDYPNLTVWVLDDGRRDWLRDFCARKGARYIRRATNAHAKAGNINHALGLTSGEFVAIFDADFVPHRNFVYRTLGFFEDAAIGCVQTPQHFFNKDPIQLNLGLDRVWPDEQRFFFHTIMPSRDAWGAAFCCGSCTLIRRAALDAIGGIPTDSVTEDILASLVMIRRGYRTIYLDEQLSLGLAPESIEGFFVQRQRWCRGNIQLVFLRGGPFGPGLPPAMRLFSLPTYYLLQPAQLLFLIIPVLYLWLGLSPVPTFTAGALLEYQTPALIACFLALIWFSKASWVPILSTASSLFQAIRLTPTVLASYVKPFGVGFKVTPKGNLDRRLVLDRQTAMVAGSLLFLTVAGLALNTSFEYRIVGGDALFRIAAFWGIWNALALFLLLLITIERPRRRAEERFALGERAQCSLRDVGVACDVLDLSAGGAKLRFDEKVEAHQGTGVTLDLDGVGRLAGRIAWSARGDAGLRFGDLEPAMREALQARLAALAVAKPHRGRRADRIALGLRANCRVDRLEMECVIENASITGLLLGFGAATPAIGSLIEVEMPGVGLVRGKVVRQVGGDRLGLQFDNMPERDRDRLIRRLYTEGIGYPQQMRVEGAALIQALLARAFG